MAKILLKKREKSIDLCLILGRHVILHLDCVTYTANLKQSTRQKLYE